ncbi:dTDP-4-dehydrorhamnose reductase [bacterium]|nr:dTDP-4-dehydrorhamnose reductase [bacterium]
MMKILVTGAKGQLGRALIECSRQTSNKEWVFIDVEELDLTEKDQVDRYIRKIKPTWIINTAAYTKVDQAESDSKRAFKINASAVKTIADAALEVNASLLHISTDFVFDGKKSSPYAETDITAPLSVYGQSKREGEVFAEKSGVPGVIIRTSWLYGSRGENFVETMLRLGKEKKEIGVVSDQIGTPTWADDLAKAIMTIVEDYQKKEMSLFHYSSAGVASWYDFAHAVIEYSGCNCRIKPIKTIEYPLPAQRPTYSVLDTSKIQKEFKIEIPHWRDSLKQYIQSR